jgi:hypothetical protein
MKIIAAVLFVFASLNTNTSSGQVNIHADSIKNMLCHKWGYKATIISGKRRTDLNESITYEFFADSTLKRVTSSGKTESGTWEYIAQDKFIELKINKVDLLIPIISLSPKELIVWTGDRNRSGIGAVLKPSAKN